MASGTKWKRELIKLIEWFEVSLRQRLNLSLEILDVCSLLLLLLLLFIIITTIIIIEFSH